jgi:hypothetical protein
MMLSKISIIIFGRRNDILRLIILNFSFLRWKQNKNFYFVESTTKHFSLIIEEK